MDAYTLQRACDEFAMHSSCSKRTVMVSQYAKLIILNKISLEFIHILHKVRLMGRTDKVWGFSAHLPS